MSFTQKEIDAKRLEFAQYVIANLRSGVVKTIIDKFTDQQIEALILAMLKAAQETNTKATPENYKQTFYQDLDAAVSADITVSATYLLIKLDPLYEGLTEFLDGLIQKIYQEFETTVKDGHIIWHSPDA